MAVMGAKSGLLLVACAVAMSVAAGASREVLVTLKQANVDKLEAELYAVSDPRSSRYGNYLTVEDVKAVVGLGEAGVKEVTAWLRESGAQWVSVGATGDYAVASMEESAAGALVAGGSARPEHVEMVAFHGRTAISVAAGADGVTTVTKQRAQSKLERMAEDASRGPAPGADEVGGPNQQRAAYGVPSGTTGSASSNKQMVWGPGTYGYLESDLSEFYSLWNVNNPTSNVAKFGNAGTPGGDNFGEATLDTQYISAVGTGVKTLVANTNTSSSTEEGNGFGYAFLDFTLELAAMADADLPAVLSLSLGSLSFDSCNLLCVQAVANTEGLTLKQCQTYLQTQRQVCMFTGPPLTSRINTELMKLGTRGVTILAAAGDGGSHFSFMQFDTSNPIGSALNNVSCTFNMPTFPSASPYVTSVGGTTWSGAGASPSNPVAWVSSGGGFAWEFGRPSYQATAVKTYLTQNADKIPAHDAFGYDNRGYPDVAALATGIPVVMDGVQQMIGGTSAATPEFAGVVSLINDHRLNKGLPRLGFLNPRLYQTDAAHPGEMLYDMDVGNSNCCYTGYCCATGFPASKGWDPTTGLGRPIFSGMIKYLGAAP